MKLPWRANHPAAVIRATDHPIRRRALRWLHDGRPRSTAELSEELGEPLSRVAYHMRVLLAGGAVRPAGKQLSPDPEAIPYESAVSGKRQVRTRLAATEAGDEPLRLRRLIDKRPHKAI